MKSKVTLSKEDSHEIYQKINFWEDSWTPEATAAVEAWGEKVAAMARAEALRECAEKVNLHKYIPRGRADLDELCQDDDCLWWDMTYALQDDLNDQARLLLSDE